MVSQDHESSTLTRKIHPAANLFPMMSQVELESLADSIREYGQNDPIVLWKGLLIDGRNRIKACEIAGIEVEESELQDEDDPVAFVMSANLHRRHLTTSQRTMAAAKLANMKRGDNQHTKEGGSICRPSLSTKEGPSICRPSLSTKEAADMFRVSTKNVGNAKSLIAKASPAIVAAVESGDLSVNKAVKLVEAVPSKAEQTKVVAGGNKAINEKVKVVPGGGNYFGKFTKIWNAADEVGRAAIRVFVSQDDPEEELRPPPPPTPGKSSRRLTSADVTFPDGMNSAEARESLDDWLTYKRSRRQSYKDAGSVEALLSQFVERYQSRAGLEFVAAVRLARSNNWAGCIFEDSNDRRQSKYDRRQFKETRPGTL